MVHVCSSGCDFEFIWKYITAVHGSVCLLHGHATYIASLYINQWLIPLSRPVGLKMSGELKNTLAKFLRGVITLTPPNFLRRATFCWIIV